ncbi:hypothetical protein N7533_013415 [Penicillium manginii]|uniref:uncharacterized protein n=1 Tax=Penicillium manginii TaxID=203109 RepID=UPI002548E349|nr:uncharacterized protein N7533_013415 [Penicillium manginii]KAJ5732968.1 hypothetical protein N7533_013415 [Penicillium manginii]
MSWFANLCGCFTRSDATPQPSNPEMQSRSPTYTRNGVQTGQFTLSDEGHFIRTDHGHGHGHGPPPADSEVGGYATVVPLPQYTPRPMSVNEKTLESHLRDPSVSSDSNSYDQDEKNPHLYNEDLSSDASSVISYPSSYGNTSTATRETPPPPYSPRQSAQLTRTRSVSLYSMSSTRGITINPPPIARLNGARSTGPPPSDGDDQSIRRHRRLSWESR